MLQCCSLETSHPPLLPQSPKVCSVHLCLFFCFAYRVIIYGKPFLDCIISIICSVITAPILDIGHFYVASFLHRAFPDGSVGTESTCSAEDPSLIPGSGRSAGEGIVYPHQYSWASLVAQLVKNLPAMQDIWVWSLGWEDPLEKEKATHSSILAHELYSPWGPKELDMTEWLSLSLSSQATWP